MSAPHRGEHVTHRLIFVCEANICRSPLMEQVLRSRVDAELWEISSAGTRVGPGDRPMCTMSVEIAAAAGADETALDTHRSTSIDADTLLAADLILTASRAERSTVAQLVPEARSKTFTLLEAIHLGAAAFRQDELELLADFVRDDAVDGLEIYAAALHHRRGFVAPPSVGRTLWGKRRRNAFDIPDAHHEGDREHRAMLERTAGDIVELQRQVELFLDSPAAALDAR